jgi:hypothetical protein
MSIRTKHNPNKEFVSNRIFPLEKDPMKHAKKKQSRATLEPWGTKGPRIVFS